MLGVAFGVLSPMFVGAREKRNNWVSLKGRPQDRFVYSTEAETFAVAMAREWVYKVIK